MIYNDYQSIINKAKTTDLLCKFFQEIDWGTTVRFGSRKSVNTGASRKYGYFSL